MEISKMTEHEKFEFWCNRTLHIEDLIDRFCASKGINEQLTSQLKDVVLQKLCRITESFG
jgi:hypothetical protein